MSWVASAITMTLTGIASERAHAASRKTAKTAKHAKERSIGRARELSDSANDAARASKDADRADAAKRVAGYNRNLNIFGSSASSMADRARKTLTGQ